MEEEWIELDGDRKYGKYSAISNLGRLRKNDGTIVNSEKGQILGNKGKPFHIKVFVAEHFLITVKRPDQKSVHYVSKNPEDGLINSVTNLEYATQVEISNKDDVHERIVSANRKIWESEETRKKMRISQRKTWSDPVLRARQSIIIRNNLKDENLRKKISEAIKNSPKKAETRKKLSEASKKMWLDPERRKKISLAHRANWSDLEYRKNMLPKIFGNLSKCNSSRSNIPNDIATWRKRISLKSITATIYRRGRKYQEDPSASTICKRKSRSDRFEKRNKYLIQSIKSEKERTYSMVNDLDVVLSILEKS
jgi:hypothetical protein